jgi:hypothetical protein
MLILFSHLHLGPSIVFFLNLYSLHFVSTFYSLLRVTYPVHLSLLDLITLSILGKVQIMNYCIAAV